MTPDCTIIVRSAAELLAVTPYVLGFHPSDSLVVIGLDGEHVTLGVRYDLSPPITADSAAYIAELVGHQAVQRVALIGYGPPVQVTQAILRVDRALQACGVRVEDALRVTGGRWWSYHCDSPHCCPPEGRSCPPPGNAKAAEAVYRGRVALPDRQTLI